MALTPEDVVKKEFTKPKGFGRSGYDEIQVDDFLDEIVVELRRLNTENEDLTGKLEDSRRSSGVAGKESGSTPASAASGIPDLKPADSDDADKTQTIPAVALSKDASAADGPASDAALVKAREDLAAARRELQVAKDDREKVRRDVVQAQERLAALQKQIEQVEAGSKERVQSAEKRALAAESAAESKEQEAGQRHDVSASAKAAPVGADSAAGVIALAQRLHDEHVREGETTRDQLIREAREKHAAMINEATATREKLLAEGKATHDELIGTGQSKHDELIGEATAKHDELIGTGQGRHDELIGTGQSRHDELMRQANERSTGLVKEAEERKARILGQLTSEREEISTGIQRLQSFENDYRSKLKGFIEGQLQDLNHGGDSTPEDSEDAQK